MFWYSTSTVAKIRRSSQGLGGLCYCCRVMKLKAAQKYPISVWTADIGIRTQSHNPDYNKAIHTRVNHLYCNMDHQAMYHYQYHQTLQLSNITILRPVWRSQEKSPRWRVASTLQQRTGCLTRRKACKPLLDGAGGTMWRFTLS